MAENVHEYRKHLPKQEGEPGGSVEIQLKIATYTDAQAGDNIENPEVVEDDN